MIFIILAFFVALLGILISFRIKIGYIFSSLSSLFAIIGAVVSINHPIKILTFDIYENISLNLHVDKISGIFLLFVSIAWLFISLFSRDYGYRHGKNSEIYINATFIGILLILISSDFVSFLCGWEIMTIFIYLMILSEKEVDFSNSFKFFSFSELSTISLIIGFSYLFFKTGTTKFTNLPIYWPFLIFTTIGFIIKMDIVPFHTWMKNVYDKAPTNVCAILSGPVTLMGVYGLIRISKLHGIHPPQWYVILLAIGGVSAFWGSLHAASTGGLKILPAYSTVENNGFILTALSFSYLVNDKFLSDFALLTALIIAFGHLIAKTLLFISIGHAKESYKAITIDEVKGVWKGVGMLTGLGIVISCLSLSAFPPLIGYVGEWMLLESLFQSYKFIDNFYRFFGTFVGILVALGIGLCGFAMIKLIGYTALGYHHEKKRYFFPDKLIKISEFSLIFIIIAMGIASPYLIKILGYSHILGGALGVPKPYLIKSNNPPFGVISPTFLFIVIGLLFILPFFIYLKTSKKVRKVNSFNGALPLKEDEYFTAKSFSYILEHILSKFYRTKEIILNRKFEIVVIDLTEGFYTFFKNAFLKIGFLLSKILMNGKIHWYIIYILILFILCFFI